MDKSETDKLYTKLNERYNDLYWFVMHYNEYIYSFHKYGGEYPLTMIDTHTISYIDDNPGTTSEALIKLWDKTKGSVSQVITRLENMGLVEKRKEGGNLKTVYLYLTDKGKQISKLHKEYDIKDVAKTIAELNAQCSKEEISTFFKVISAYNEVIRKDFELNPGHRTRRKN